MSAEVLPLLISLPLPPLLVCRNVGQSPYKRVACHFYCLAYPNYSQIGHFESDALKRDLHLRSSTHNQMKAELELFPAVSIDSGVYARGQKL